MKTTLAQLYVKATLCENRLEGTSEACGHCDVCEKGTHANIEYYRITEASSFKEVVSDLISISKCAPAIISDEVRADNHRRFIIIDELQNATRQSISPFLDSLEFASDTTTVILVSMDLDKLDPIVRDAIESRCIELGLDTLSYKAIADRLFDKYPKAEREAMNLIARLSNGNMRKAWSIFEYFIAQVSEESITADLVYSQKYGGLNSATRDEFYECLFSLKWEDSKKLIAEFLVNSNNETIAKTLLEDLIQKDLTEKGIELLSVLSVWLQSSYKVPIEACFIQFQSVSIFKDHEVVTTVDSPPTKDVKPIPNKVMGLPLEATPKALREASTDILKQFSTMIGKKVVVEKQVPKWFTVNSWEELLKLDDNNH